MATPVLDALLSGNMSDKRGIADSLSRMRSVGTLLQGGSRQNQAMGAGLEAEAAESTEGLRRIGVSNRDQLARLRAAQIGAAGRGGPSEPSKAKWTNYADEEFKGTSRLSEDLRTMERLMAEVEAEGGEAARPGLAVMKDIAANALGNRAANWLADTQRTPAEKRLMTHMNKVDSNIRHDKYGSALTSGEIGYSFGSLLEGATDTDMLLYRVQDMRKEANDRLKELDAAFDMNPYFQSKVAQLTAEDPPREAAPEDMGGALPESEPVGELWESDGVTYELMPDGSGRPVK